MEKVNDMVKEEKITYECSQPEAHAEYHALGVDCLCHPALINATFYDKDELPVRMAQCSDCKRIVKVNEKNRRLYIITPRPEWEMDSMYDGCRGWD